MSDHVTPESEQHEQNMRDLRLIRDDPGWALTAVQEWRRLAAQLEAARKVIEAARSVNVWFKENADWPKETALDLALAAYDEQVKR